MDSCVAFPVVVSYSIATVLFVLSERSTKLLSTVTVPPSLYSSGSDCNRFMRAPTLPPVLK